jgi:type I restriction enzyme S subunit
MGQDVCLLRKKSNENSTEFLQSIFQSTVILKQLADLKVGTTFKRANVQQIRSFAVPMPPPPEQHAIATALSDVDGLLGGLDRLIAKKRDLKQAAMQQLLTGQTRLPGFRGEWEVKRLGDVAEIMMGQSPSSSNYNISGMGLPLIQGNADIDNRKTIKRIFTTHITKQGKCGDILMSVRAPVGEVARAVFDVCLGRGVCAIRGDSSFLYHSLVYLEPTWAKHSKGSTFDSVNSADVKAFELPLPASQTEQIAIAEVLTVMDAELAALVQRHDKTRALKQAMMQELLTGRTRLVEVEKTRPESKPSTV